MTTKARISSTCRHGHDTSQPHQVDRHNRCKRCRRLYNQNVKLGTQLSQAAKSAIRMAQVDKILRLQLELEREPRAWVREELRARMQDARVKLDAMDEGSEED